MMEALKQLKSTTSTRALIAMLEQGKPLTLNDGDLRIDTRILAAQSLGWTESKLPVQPLIKALASEEEPLRLAAVDALRLLTNHQFYKRWSKAHRSKRAKKKLASAIESWQVWYDANKKKRRRQWVLMGFHRRASRSTSSTRRMSGCCVVRSTRLRIRHIMRSVF